MSIISYEAMQNEGILCVTSYGTIIIGEIMHIQCMQR